LQNLFEILRLSDFENNDLKQELTFLIDYPQVLNRLSQLNFEELLQTFFVLID